MIPKILPSLICDRTTCLLHDRALRAVYFFKLLTYATTLSKAAPVTAGTAGMFELRYSSVRKTESLTSHSKGLQFLG